VDYDLPLGPPPERLRGVIVTVIRVHPGGNAEPKGGVSVRLQNRGDAHPSDVMASVGGPARDVRVYITQDGVQLPGEKRIPVLWPGQTADRTDFLVEPGAGTYEMVCTYRNSWGDHYEGHIPLIQESPEQWYECGKKTWTVTYRAPAPPRSC